MANMIELKAEAERLLIENIKEIGLASYYQMNGEGRRYSKVYYCFNLKNGGQRFWTDPSEKFKAEIGIK